MPLKIDIGKYVITSDPHNIIVNIEKVKQEGDNAGQKYLSPISYHRTLPDAIESMTQKNIRDSDATTLKQLYKELKELRALLEKSLEGQ